jgi:predicted metal-dependent phosphoesterase TrpH
MTQTPRRIDLHLHSTASDGQYTPAEVVALALQRGLDAIALTDHDTTAGLAEALAAAENTGLRVLTGVELGTWHGDINEVHLLGYCFIPDDADFQERLRWMRDERRVRAEKMVARLAELGAPITLARVLEIAGEAAVGRPHVAQALLEAGHVASCEEAFARYLADGGPAYIPRLRLSLPEAIAQIHAVGGAAVLAHPFHLPDAEALLPALLDAGLDGLEAFYPDHDAAFTARMVALAHHHDLIVTGGSDFHRPQPDGSLILGTVDVPPDCLARLEARAARYQK